MLRRKETPARGRVSERVNQLFARRLRQRGEAASISGRRPRLGPRLSQKWKRVAAPHAGSDDVRLLHPDRVEKQPLREGRLVAFKVRTPHLPLLYTPRASRSNNNNRVTQKEKSGGHRAIARQESVLCLHWQFPRRRGLPVTGEVLRTPVAVREKLGLGQGTQVRSESK